jgi:hypothetical protein
VSGDAAAAAHTLAFPVILLGALSSCMTFLDLTEGDTLAVVVVELHVGPMRQCDALGN